MRMLGIIMQSGSDFRPYFRGFSLQSFHIDGHHFFIQVGKAGLSGFKVVVGQSRLGFGRYGIGQRSQQHVRVVAGGGMSELVHGVADLAGIQVKQGGELTFHSPAALIGTGRIELLQLGMQIREARAVDQLLLAGLGACRGGTGRPLGVERC